MVDGKLTEMEREPREVQVVLTSSMGESGATTDALLLQDCEGVFMTVVLTQGLDTEQETTVEISGERRGSEIATTPPMAYQKTVAIARETVCLFSWNSHDRNSLTCKQQLKLIVND